MTSVDIVSDLHEDYWNLDLPLSYPCGSRRHKPFKIIPSPDTDILIVAGDIADDITVAWNYLVLWAKKYKTVLYVDGNHEHTSIIPKLFSPQEIADYITRKGKEENIKNIFYLPIQPFIINKTVFIGISGWWNYCEGKSIQTYTAWLCKWLPYLREEDGLIFRTNVIKQASHDYQYLCEVLNLVREYPDINKIVIVTHTVPIRSFSQKDYLPTELNGLMKGILKNKKTRKMITHWIFGHTHAQHDKIEKGITFLCHPRGRPDDFNRENYKQLNKII